jgi:predicted transcriptional regulator
MKKFDFTRRSRLDIIGDLLNFCSSNEKSRISDIQLKLNLSSTQLYGDYLPLLKNTGLLVEKNNGSEKLYRTSKKGMGIANIYKEIKKLLKEI